MNTNEKRKLEGAVTSKLATSATVFRQRRKAEYEGLVEEMRNNRPAEVTKLIEKAELARSAYLANCQKVEAEMAKLGFSIYNLKDDRDQVDVELIKTSRWINGSYEYTYTEPSLTAHADATNKVLAGIDDLRNRYYVEIWSDGAEMKTTFEKFEKEITKLLA